MLSEMDREFIHLATEKQISRIVEKFWQDAPTVIAVKVDTQKLPGTLVLESNPGGSTKFYHLYDGFIPQEAVVEIKEIVTK